MTNLNSSATNPNGQPASLLPCPFCGRDAELHQTYHPGSAKASAWFAWCGSDECPVKPMTNDYETYVEAIAVWNHRVERTCEREWRDNPWGGYTEHCGACGADLGCDTRNNPQNYCPNCGAKVVE